MPEITHEVVALEAAELAEDGRRYTPRQLYYASCAAVEAPRIAFAPGFFALGAVFWLVAIITMHFRPVAIALLLIGSIMFLGGLRQRLLEGHRLISVRARALGYDQFHTLFIAPSDATWPGMLDPATWVPAALPSSADATPQVVVCDTTENAVIVEELARRHEWEIVVATRESLADDAAGRRLIAVHDASVAGSALPLALKDDGAKDVIDAAIRPRDVEGRDLQVIEGAPGVRPPRDLGPVLSTDEQAWYSSGRRLELAAFPVDSLTRILEVTLGVVAPAPVSDDAQISDDSGSTSASNAVVAADSDAASDE